MRNLGGRAGLWQWSANQPGYRYQWQALQSGGLVTLPSGIVFACASTRTAQINASQLITGIGANQPVICYNPFLNAYGLQHEEQRTNNAYYSQTFGSWTGGTPTLSLPDPAGGVTACEMAVGTPGLFVTHTSPSATTADAVSCWIREAGTPSTPNTATFGGATAAFAPVVAGSSTPLSTWTRKAFYNLHASSTIQQSVINDTRIGAPSGASTRHAFYQWERGQRTPTSYIPTPSNAAVTRLATTIRAPIASRLTFKARFDTYVHNRLDYDPAINPSPIIFYDASATTRLMAYVATQLGSPVLQLYINAVLVYTGTNVYNFVAGDKWSWRLSFNGATYTILVYKNDAYQWTEGHTGAAPTLLTALYFGSADVGTYSFNAPVTYVGAT